MNYGIHFDRPSSRYDEALMVGTGRLGAMVSGSMQERKIWINEETVWYGGPRDRNNPDALAHMGEIRSLMAQGRIPEAERLAVMTLTGVPESQRHYSTLGLVVIDLENHQGEPSEYEHRLDFHTGTTYTSYILNGVRYEMEVFAGQPDQVIGIRLRADAPVLGFFAGIERGERVAQFSYGTHEDDILRDTGRCGVTMTGSCGGKNGLLFAGSLYGSCNGTMRILGDKLVCSGATEAELFITAGTDFERRGEDPADAVADRAVAARDKGYSACYASHLQEWVPLYEQAGLALDTVSDFQPPAMNRLFEAYEKDDFSLVGCDSQEMRQKLDDYLTLLLFHFGRYALLGSSRKCQLPAALQGIWCQDLLSVWDGKYTTNINLQMNYWPADSANLSDCFLPYLQLAERIRENGMVTAQKMYGCRGFVLHNNTDIWADTAVQDSGTHCSYWFLGGVWIACDMYEHYRYTRDVAFLKRAWPIMRDAALFVLDFMEERDGELVMGVTSSPENFYIDDKGNRVSFCEMAAIDSQMIALLLRQCGEAAAILEKTYGSVEMAPGFLEEVRTAAGKLRGTKIGKDGAILEWGKEVTAEGEPMHRHLSHLLGAYPYNQITEHDPVLFQAVSDSLDKRIRNGGCNTGWGRAWGAGIMARLKRGDEARDMVNDMLRYSGQPNLMSCCNVGRAPKLLDTTKPMQIDGTMGTVQAVLEMLLQSYNDNEIWILPALPASWASGSFRGLLARGNVQVDAQWENGKLKTATLMPGCDGQYVVRCRNAFRAEVAGEELLAPAGELVLQAKSGVPCRITG